MLKKVFLVLSLVALLAMPSVALAEGEYNGGVIDQPHKVYRKWDMSGQFPGMRNWGLGQEMLWNYEFHIKEANAPQYSVGTIHFWTEGVDVVAHVEETKWGYGYQYWDDNEALAAVGWTNYNDVHYNVMFLLQGNKVWMALSESSYTNTWTIENVWQSADRAYEVHSYENETFVMDPKVH